VQNTRCKADQTILIAVHLASWILHIFSIYDNEMENEIIYQTSRDPKTLQLERTEDGRYRLVISVKKLGAFTAVEYFLDRNEAEQLSQALTK
jgi:hypothetical protein